jgi:hypothetical protein
MRKRGKRKWLSIRYETRIPVSRATVLALKSQMRGREPYDTFLRRLLISSCSISHRCLKAMEDLTPEEQAWVINDQNVEAVPKY